MSLTKELDIVNKAPHYNTGKYEVIDVAEDWGLDKCAYLFNSFKYISRAGKKDPGKLIEDLKKAEYYLKRKIRNLELEEKMKKLSQAVVEIEIDLEELKPVDLEKEVVKAAEPERGFDLNATDLHVPSVKEDFKVERFVSAEPFINEERPEYPEPICEAEPAKEVSEDRCINHYRADVHPSKQERMEKKRKKQWDGSEYPSN